LAGRNNRLRIGTKFAAIEAVGGTFPRVDPVDWLVAKWAAHWGNVRYRLPAQPVDATQVLNLSAGVSNPKVFRGRSFS
jgi:hypothetical protein